MLIYKNLFTKKNYPISLLPTLTSQKWSNDGPYFPHSETKNSFFSHQSDQSTSVYHPKFSLLLNTIVVVVVVVFVIVVVIVITIIPFLEYTYNKYRLFLCYICHIYPVSLASSLCECWLKNISYIICINLFSYTTLYS